MKREQHGSPWVNQKEVLRFFLLLQDTIIHILANVIDNIPVGTISRPLNVS